MSDFKRKLAFFQQAIDSRQDERQRAIEEIKRARKDEWCRRTLDIDPKFPDRAKVASMPPRVEAVEPAAPAVAGLAGAIDGVAGLVFTLPLPDDAAAAATEPVPPLQTQVAEAEASAGTADVILRAADTIIERTPTPDTPTDLRDMVAALRQEVTTLQRMVAELREVWQVAAVVHGADPGGVAARAEREQAELEAAVQRLKEEQRTDWDGGAESEPLSDPVSEPARRAVEGAAATGDASEQPKPADDGPKIRTPEQRSDKKLKKVGSTAPATRPLGRFNVADALGEDLARYLSSQGAEPNEGEFHDLVQAACDRLGATKLGTDEQFDLFTKSPKDFCADLSAVCSGDRLGDAEQLAATLFQKAQELNPCKLNEDVLTVGDMRYQRDTAWQGGGSYGSVTRYMADGGKTVVVKRAFKQGAKDLEGNRELALEEARTHRIAMGEHGEGHPNLVKQEGVICGEDGELLQIQEAGVMDFGTFLERFHAQDPKIQDEMRDSLIRNVTVDITSGLLELQKNGLNNTDLKPANCVVGTDGNLKLIDYGGMAQVREDSAAVPPQAKEEFDISPAFASPELAKLHWEPEAQAKVGPRSATYILGNLLEQIINPRVIQERWAPGVLASEHAGDETLKDPKVGDTTSALLRMIKHMMKVNPKHRPPLEAIRLASFITQPQPDGGAQAPIKDFMLALCGTPGVVRPGPG